MALHEIKMNLATRFWGICLGLLFVCARMVCTLIKMPIRGALVAVWHEGQILLIRKSYRKGWSVPGGLLKKGETRKQAAVRETFEEVGIKINEEDLVYVAEVAGDLGPNDVAHLFEVQIDTPIKIAIDNREIVQAEFVTPQVAVQRDLYDHIIAYLQPHVSS